MFIRQAAAAAILAVLLPFAVHAEEAKHDHSMQHAMKAGDAPSSKAFTEASAKMHRDMMADLTGDADVDFVRGMIPHHQGAIDMARIELQYGKDPAIRAMAEAIIKAQEAEIAEMKQWLEKHGK